MAPKSCQEAEDAEEEALPSLVDREPVSGHVGPPAGAAADPVAPTHPQNAKPSSTRMVSSISLQPALESLDPRALRLLWGQRELEIQALRWAVQHQRAARRRHILQEVAGLPAERSSRSQEKFLQNQVQKLTLELKAQKEKAQLEKKLLEERLQQTGDALQQLEAELQAFQKSCLLQLAHSSWVGRVLRSSTGSVEVVTAETLMDLSDFSENDQAPAAGEGFRLEDVDWNSIAHRYPNLFTNLESNSDQKHARTPQLPAASPPDQRSSELCCRHQEHNLKSVEWSSLPLAGTSSSGGADSESSNSQRAAHNRVHKVTRDRPPVPGRTAKQVEAQAQSLCRDGQATSAGAGAHHPSCPDLIPTAAPLPRGPSGHCGPGPASQEMSSVDPGPSKLGFPSQAVRLSVHLQNTHSDEQGENGQKPESGVDSHLWHSRRCPSPSPTGSCLKIMAVSRRQRFVRILNQSPEETVDLGGFVLQQLVLDFPVCLYRFPPSTLLAPRHHVTVWGEGPCSTRRQQPSSLGQEPVHFYSSRSCVTLLLNPQGEVLSEHQSPHCVTPVSRIFADNTDLSIDCFPLSEARPGADLAEHQPQPRPLRKGRVREARAGRRRPGWGPRVPRCLLPPQARTGKDPRLPAGTAPHLPRSHPSACSGLPSGLPPPQAASAPGPPLPAGRLSLTTPPYLARPRVQLPRLSTIKLLRQREAPVWPEDVAQAHPELLPAIPIPAEVGVGLQDCRGRKEHKIRAPPPPIQRPSGSAPRQVCRKRVDRGCPMVALSVQSTAESRFGFRFLSCPPITADTRWPL
ncbi:lamin tail domain-containing protein 2 isoform X1 [Ovis aries]|uniref:lamin tail domain-containing protein 2 isoform X1 n=1 Tax=Ovis aries TaxID=9940 RepID=UPI0005FB6426|nr:lamin tail domain-containing protein 2 isoform X1 [Ovis aries]XP_042093651.1 lamin tail domain-containing protein 2 isoform X1 [Ovis aries]XP_060260154.1 lamin tail domain-containing protein 2 isoform X1 [Ovis aries]XP_060260155.1 lamin tail domain-containing protein 2 isoform X1 [Ovis aries]XP_060260156.1 lamin tail domain-containing protein 2 isoform X1 [Ovis aries]XP_060260157.1 lamin tail domain-containing protein 2 isoform X1 [Ovis aries]